MKNRHPLINLLRKTTLRTQKFISGHNSTPIGVKNNQWNKKIKVFFFAGKPPWVAGKPLKIAEKPSICGRANALQSPEKCRSPEMAPEKLVVAENGAKKVVRPPKTVLENSRWTTDAGTVPEFGNCRQKPLRSPKTVDSFICTCY